MGIERGSASVGRALDCDKTGQEYKTVNSHVQKKESQLSTLLNKIVIKEGAKSLLISHAVTDS